MCAFAVAVAGKADTDYLRRVCLLLTQSGHLSVSRIIRSAFGAVDQDPVNLVLVGMQQDGGATTAGVVNGMLARH
jgi:hypothetical protein